jgi:hypothetical protein
MKTPTKAIALISLVVLAAVAGILLVELQSTMNSGTVTAVGQEESTPAPSAITQQDNNALNDSGGFMSFRGRGGPEMFGGMGGGPGGRCGMGGFGCMQVSQDYVANVTNIAKADSDVQNLLNSGYNITAVRPIVSTSVDGNGNIATKASTAELTLIGTNGRALVIVDLDQAKVTKIVTTTMTQIQK